MHVADCRRNMWMFLGLFMVLTVSGDQEYDNITVHGLVNESVLLPCNCTNINVSATFSWEKVSPIKEGIMSLTSINDSYRGRVKLLLNESVNNCSLLFYNITADNQGLYRCNYHVSEVYRRVHVDLQIYEHIKTRSKGKRLFMCDVFTRNPNTELRWRFKGAFLNSSFETNISSTAPTNFSPIYIFNSTLATQVDMTPEPECVHGDKNVLNAQVNTPQPQPQPDALWIYITVPIVLTLGLSLAACLCWNVTRRRKRGYVVTGPVEIISSDNVLFSGGG